jgi:peptidoglycan/xylan/chitin deacetylase (PgdA/CDA1 family)
MARSSFITRITSATAYAVAAFAVATAALAPLASAQTVVLTFDDGPTLAETPRMSPPQRNQAMLDALARHRVKAVLFVTAGNGANQPEGYALAKAWGDAGHLVGNHTMTHPGIDDAGVSLAQYQQQILDCDAITSTLPGYRKWFRYPYMNLSASPAKRADMQAFLRRHGYRDAPVSIAAEDWVVADKVTAALTADPKADVEPIRRAYLEAVRSNALASLAGTDKNEVKIMLLHHNLANALWLEDVIKVFEKLGWGFAQPDLAFPPEH